MDTANKARTTHSTAANDTSSRSHSICQISLRRNNTDCGKLVLVDLAGSERAQDTQSNNRQRRMEGAEINKRYVTVYSVYLLSKNAFELWVIRQTMFHSELQN